LKVGKTRTKKKQKKENSGYRLDLKLGKTKERTQKNKNNSG
jgi:hypothetical protein